MRPVVLAALALGIAFAAAPAPADERLKGVACRSVHLQYPAPEGVAFYNEVTVEQSAEGTYFCACGWGKGYFGIQEKAAGKKLALFSVWDPAAGDDPKKVPEGGRVQLLHTGDGVRVGRFGNEGTGGQAFFDCEWKVGETYRFLVLARPHGADRTAYAGCVCAAGDEGVGPPRHVRDARRGKASGRVLLVRRGLQAGRGLGGEGAEGPVRQRLGQDDQGRMDAAGEGPVHRRPQPGCQHRRGGGGGAASSWPRAGRPKTGRRG